MREVTNRIAETVRIQYASGLYNINGLVERWVPEVSASDLQRILKYEVLPNVKPELKVIVDEIGGAHYDIILAAEGQYVVIPGCDDSKTPVEDYWNDRFIDMQLKYKWMTKSIFRSLKSLSVVGI